MSHKILKVHPNDNVLVALADLLAGEAIAYDSVALSLIEDIPAKHKIAQQDMAPGEEIIMYGTLVGKAVELIPAGARISTENVKHQASAFSGKTKTLEWQAPDVSKWTDKTFMGYHREDGQVGTANYWLVIPLVFCENRNVNIIKQAFLEELGFGRQDLYKSYVQQMVALYQEGKLDEIEQLPLQGYSSNAQKRLFDNIDGIKFLTHEGGCGGIRQDSDALCALLAGYIHNPNVAGATVLSLGCQNAQTYILEEKLRALNPNFSKPLIVLEQQQEGTEQELLSRAIKQTFLGLVEANKEERQPAPLSKLVIGLECGGSDGFSGISANPTVGQASDLVVALGGKSILSEFPELCGVEQELINRCVDEKAAERFAHLMRAYAHAAEAVGSGFDMNPSPGNIKDGLITDAIKSAGAAKKGGTSPVVDVLDYTEYVTKPGLTLLCTPGNDVESTTAMAGSGANIILFTTGLGTPTGNPVTPVIKVSSNTKLAQRMPDIIDVDTGPVIAGEKTIEEMGAEMLDFIIEVASGNIKTKAQQLDQDDFIPWKRGISL
ncbi:altronate hydrolase [Pontibacter ummariensis]|uniref:Altronate hydrolase n=1 Tax=Pontibacter ummariensis TaxID=1610492 RepID=A0A239H3W3_9BACT|nr:altronate dehydratase family protein [Pontibacter ummariensis]PRY10901.1 altronate hydrolase [Pontibacter ummariensis]SNS75881.1 altronate hydrolase [Pontibacter ummariensis]